MEQGEPTIYRSCMPVVDAQYSPESGRSPAEVIIDALAEAGGIDPFELPPLYEFVDGDALNSLFEERDGANKGDALLSFRVENWNVFIRADGRIRVCDGTRPTDPEPIFESTPV
jgi:hypothetical protein